MLQLYSTKNSLTLLQPIHVEHRDTVGNLSTSEQEKVNNAALSDALDYIPKWLKTDHQTVFISLVS